MVRALLVSALAALVAVQTQAALPLLVRENTFLKHLHKVEETNSLEAATAVNDEYFEKQLLDHNVNPNCGENPTYWKQRFQVNDQYYKGPGSPVFFFIHGENVADPLYITSKGMFVNYAAQKYGALIVALEHRFYGLSQPTPDMSTENLKYHTSDQALGDIGSFSEFFASHRNISSSSPWIAFGGSYPGMLAAWTKFRYPDRFVGSIASSAPIDIKADFFEYMNIVARGLHYYGGDECTNTLQEGLKQFHALVASDKPDDLAKLNKLFNPCTPITTDLDRMDIEANIMGVYQGFAQNNDWDSYVLKHACADLTAKDGLTPLEKVAKINSRTYAECTNSNYQKDWVKAISDTTTDTANIYRQWTFQTCNEFGFGQTAAKSTGPFSELKYVTVERVYYQMCKDVFGITDSDSRIAAKRANYHGLDINVGNVIFPSGTIDPWSALSVSNTTKLANPTSKSVYIEGTSHCDDMYTPSAKDSLPLQNAKKEIDAAIASFINKSNP